MQFISENSNFSQEVIDKVWEKGITIPGMNPNIMRKDIAGACMRYREYGNRDSKYGWEIDHKYPVSKGGSDDLRNLQPLQWQNNCRKDDNYPNFQTCVTSVGTINIDFVQNH